jgi:ribosomal protein S18 acetylase RimI-like enzyme
MINVSPRVRPATIEDRQQIATLMFFESHVHRHLDWYSPLDLLGSSSYWVVEESQKVMAVLACPRDPETVAWIRLFAHSTVLPLEKAWQPLWEQALNEFYQQGGGVLAAIALQNWFQAVLTESGFINRQNIIMLEWKDSFNGSYSPVPGLTVRPMTEADLPEVAKVDNAAFEPLWQNSISSLQTAFPQAAVATVALQDHRIVGYQISTQNPFGAHLARLAVLPDLQSRGVGSSLLGDLLAQLRERSINRVTVNTQSDNRSSQALYERMGFVRTGEQYPVYEFRV